VRVLVQPSGRRVFTDHEFLEAGATVQEDLSSATLLLAVKTVPPPLLIADRTYMFFSHTIKAQPDNMPMLDVILRKNIRLFDYECIIDPKTGRRLVAFGEFAGMAGMIDFLRGLGERLLALGYSTPFLHLASSYMYVNLEAAQEAVRRVGNAIRENGLPAPICPLTFVFTATGRVSQGAISIFKLLPFKIVSPFELDAIVNSKGADCHVVYGAVATSEHMVVRRDKPSAHFDKDHYYSNPEIYNPIFHEKVLPYTSVLVNCMYWDARYPRLVTTAQINRLHAGGTLRLIGICDISCDLEGSVEFLVKYSSIDRPFYMYNIDTGETCESLDGDGILFHAVDHLPSELAREASIYFGDALLPFIPALLSSNGMKPFADQTDLPGELREACITAHGQLTPTYAYIAQLRQVESRSRTLRRSSWGGGDLSARSSIVVTIVGHLFDAGLINATLDIIEKSGAGFVIEAWDLGQNRHTPSSAVIKVHSSNESTLEEVAARITHMAVPADASVHINTSGSSGDAVEAVFRHRILLLGSGFVAAPVVDYLLRSPTNHLTVGSMFLKDAKALCKGRKRTTAVQVEVTDTAALEALIDKADIVVSFVPASFHVSVAEACIKHRKHMVTASYISPQMRALHNRAIEADITILNEMGLDPGIDHMSAMKVITEVQAKGGKIVSFESFCGGLPAPEAADNPLGYKFSWNPRGVLTAGQQPSRYKENNKVIEVKGHDVLASHKPIEINIALSLEQLPNRDALPYADLYGISDVATMYRGTLRYRGFGELMAAYGLIGLFDDTERPDLAANSPSISWGELLGQVLGVTSGSESELAKAMLAKARLDSPDKRQAAEHLLRCSDWLGVLSNTVLVSRRNTLLDAFCALLQERLHYGDGERDMVLLHHVFGIEWTDGRHETCTSTLLSYGNPHGPTAMSLTVGYPSAIATQLIIEGRIKGRGVISPTACDIFEPVLGALEREGIRCVEHTTASLTHAPLA